MQAEKRIPERRCVGCGTHRPKSELIRIVRLPDGGVETDLTGKKPGRGAYVCFEEKCVDKGMKRLSRSLSAEVGRGVGETLCGIISDRRSDNNG